MENYNAVGYKVTGLTVQIQQGDVPKSLFMAGLNAGDFEEVKAIIEAGGEFAVTGFSLTMRDNKLKDGTLVIPAGTAEKFKQSKIALKRTMDIGGVETELKSLYIPFMLPADSAKKDAIRLAFIGKTIAGAKVVDVNQNLAGQLGK